MCIGLDSHGKVQTTQPLDYVRDALGTVSASQGSQGVHRKQQQGYKLIKTVLRQTLTGLSNGRCIAAETQKPLTFQLD